MSWSFSLVSKETKKGIWIGQGRKKDKMSVLYSGEVETMKELKRFLNNHIGKDIRFMNSDLMDEDIDIDSYRGE